VQAGRDITSAAVDSASRDMSQTGRTSAVIRSGGAVRCGAVHCTALRLSVDDLTNRYGQIAASGALDIWCASRSAS
jgi:hypothetical protein